MADLNILIYFDQLKRFKLMLARWRPQPITGHFRYIQSLCLDSLIKSYLSSLSIPQWVAGSWPCNLIRALGSSKIEVPSSNHGTKSFVYFHTQVFEAQVLNWVQTIYLHIIRWHMHILYPFPRKVLNNFSSLLIFHSFYKCSIYNIRFFIRFLFDF